MIFNVFSHLNKSRSQKKSGKLSFPIFQYWSSDRNI